MVQDFDYAYSIAPASITATTTGEEVCIAGARSVRVIVPVGVVSTADSSNYFTFTVLQGTVSGTVATATDSGQIVAVDSWDLVINATTEGPAVYAFEFIPKATYDYIKVVATETSTASAVFGAIVEFDKIHQPASS